MLEKGATEVVKQQTSGCYNRMFLVKKARRDSCYQNLFTEVVCEADKFLMETILDITQKDDLMFSTVLQDGYFQILIQPKERPISASR